MTTTAVPEAFTVTCPPWCVVPQAKHAAHAAADEGHAFHRSAEVDASPLPAASLELMTDAEGTPLPGESPTIYLNEAAANMGGISLSDARALAESILTTVKEAQR